MNSFTDDLKAEMISDYIEFNRKPSMKILLDYIDERIDEKVDQALSDRCYVDKSEVEEMIRNFNDR